MLKPHIPKDITKRSMVPIIIGVTGHRYIKSRHEPRIRKVFDEIDRKYPNTPIIVLSPLADGADRLVAQIALDKKRTKGASLSLICPLPMPREEYEKDFDEDSKKEFGEMLAKASAWFELPLAIGSTPENIQHYGAPRDAQYLAVGKYIARHSHILIALWDGIDSGLPGGTSNIVLDRHKGRLRTMRNPLDENDNGPIYHFMVRKTETGDGEIENRREVYPGMDLYCENDCEEFEKKKASFHRILSRIEAFNIDARRTCRNGKDEIEKNRGYVIPPEKITDLTRFSRRLLHHYAVADTQAIRYQKLSDWTLFSLFFIAVSAFSCYEIYAHLFLHLHWVLLGYPSGLFLGYCVYRYADKSKLQSKHLDYRALAEGLRVQFFWIVSARGDECIDFYLRKQKSELDWIKYAIRALNIPFSREEFEEKRHMNEWTIIDEIGGRLISQVLEHWVRDQARYFTKKTFEEERRLRRQRRLGKIFFAFGVSISILLFTLQFFFLHSEWFEHVRHPLIVVIGMALAIAAAIGGYTEKLAISAQAKRYHWMSGIFTRAEAALEKRINNGEFHEARKLIFELGKEALEENADWLIIKRERPIELPTT